MKLEYQCVSFELDMQMPNFALLRKLRLVILNYASGIKVI